METPDAPTGSAADATPAPYGHACANCYRAKCRCILREGADGCERCTRLRKSCNPSRAVRKSVYRSRQPTATASASDVSTQRIQELEAKLEELSSFVQDVQAHQTQTQQYLATIVPGRQITNPQSGSFLTPTQTISGTVYNSPSSFPSPRQEDIVTIAPAAAHVLYCDYTPQEARECLTAFRTHHLQYFPFVDIPTTTGPEKLQQERPFFWLCIKAICTKSIEQQQALGRRIRDVIAHRALVECERSIDLLLGLITFLSWAKYFQRKKPELGLYMNLASVMVGDLGIDRRPPADLTVSASCFDHPGYIKHLLSLPKITNEDRRALLACYILTSLVSSLMKFDAHRWRPHIDDALQQLSRDSECPGDQELVAMARIARVMQDAVGVLWSQLSDSGGELPSILHIRPLLSSLDHVRASLPPGVVQKKMIITYLYDAEALINGLALASPGPASTYYQPTDHHRLEFLHKALHSAKAATDAFLTFTPEQYIGVNHFLLLSFRHSTQLLYRLSFLDEPGWDRSAARETADVVRCLEQCAERLEGASKIAESTGNAPSQKLFGTAAAALRSSGMAWRAALEPGEAVTEGLTDNVGIDDFFFVNAGMDLSSWLWLADTFES